MYNGIGLNTPRGSGTSGHVVRNMSALKPGQADRGRQSQQYSRDHITNAKPVDKGIIEHERRRQVEVKCLELQDELETQGTLDDTEIEERVDKLRSQLLESIDQLDFTGARPIKSFETQKLAEAKSKENARLASALRVEEEYVEGAAFDRELQELKRQRKLLEKERDLDRQRERERERESHRRYRRSNRSRSPSRDSNSDSDHRRRRRRSPRRRSNDRRRRDRSASSESGSISSSSESDSGSSVASRHRRQSSSRRHNQNSRHRQKPRRSPSPSNSESGSIHSPALKASSRAVEDGEPGEIEDLEPPHMSEESVAAPTTAETTKQTLNAEPIYSDDESSDGCIGE
ncbi:RNA-splicing factor [Coemansia sp. RSA 2337]|nr:RNA-splicing factor [Coemansia sp. S680]KAJ2112588.1 RNA-splicing factor [Coemansia sp. RSA 922]KAJ2463510.1 RNA-splicing factor [Coemansia sp. RSA 2337]